MTRSKAPRRRMRGVCRQCRQIKSIRVVVWRAGAALPEGYCGPCRERIHNDGQAMAARSKEQ